MKKITQADIATELNRSQSFVSKRLSANALRGHEILKLSKSFHVPASAFYDQDAQKKHLGKLYIQDNNTANKTNNAIAKA